jgi:hypothetical protein
LANSAEVAKTTAALDMDWKKNTDAPVDRNKMKKKKTQLLLKG